MDPEAVGDEARHVARRRFPAEESLAEGADGGDDLGRGPLGRDDLEQMQVPGRVEEMRAEASRNGSDRDSTNVRTGIADVLVETIAFAFTIRSSCSNS
jgi:hypothetical protein